MEDESKIPDFIAENPDGSLSIILRDGVVITMREPTVEDQLATKGTQEQREIALVGNLCGMSPEDVRKLTSRNYKRVQEGLKLFFD